MRRRSRGVPVPTDSCISVTTVMDVSQLYGRDNMWSRRLWRVVKPTTGVTYDDACVV